MIVRGYDDEGYSEAGDHQIGAIHFGSLPYELSDYDAEEEWHRREAAAKKRIPVGFQTPPVPDKSPAKRRKA